jgi:oxalate decarboxylase/phosphoglucose isomerase-like protein (cupin superfamily)
MERQKGAAMTLQIHNWQKEIEKMARDPNVSIRYRNLSEVNGYGFYVSIIPPGEAITGHYHPKEPEKYHIVKGQGIMLSLPAEELKAGTQPVQQPVKEGMSIDIPGRVVHRLVNNGKGPLIFFFECSLTHMDKENPARTIVQDFGGPLQNLIGS